MFHPVPTNCFVQLSPAAAMLSRPSVETYQLPPPPIPPVTLVWNLSPKDHARSDTKAVNFMTHI